MVNMLRPMIPTEVKIDLFFLAVLKYKTFPRMKFCQYFLSIKLKGQDVSFL